MNHQKNRTLSFCTFINSWIRSNHHSPDSIINKYNLNISQIHELLYECLLEELVFHCEYIIQHHNEVGQENLINKTSFFWIYSQEWINDYLDMKLENDQNLPKYSLFYSWIFMICESGDIHGDNNITSNKIINILDKYIDSYDVTSTIVHFEMMD